MPSLHELYFHDVRLKQLHLQNFRGFGDLMIEFRADKPITVFIAENGSGKSSVLDAIAEFLNRFFYKAIAGKDHEAEYNTLLGEKDIFNGRNNTFASAVLNLKYPFPDKQIFEVAHKIAMFLEENLIEGKYAKLEIEEDAWILHIYENDNAILTDYVLPDHFQNILNDLVGANNLLNTSSLSFNICIRKKNGWQPNLALSAKEVSVYQYRNGNIELNFELTRGRPDVIKYYDTNKKFSRTYKEFIETWYDGVGSITDWSKSSREYDRFNPLNENNIVLPLLVYYGGAAINIQYDNELKVPYRPRELQSYSDALIPNRFNFEEFLTWALWIYEKQLHAWDLVKSTLLDILNADQNRYKDIRFETQRLLFTKQEEEGTVPISIEVAQLSAGEKSIIGLIGDLVKRAVQLNAVLFKIDVNSSDDTLSNPLQYTPGIVLIDEIDLHLHPRWQRVIIPKLREYFPEIQFVVTTHSPIALQEVDGTILLLNNFLITPSPLLGGWKIEEILRLMGINSLYSNKNYEILVENFYDFIRDSNIEEAEIILEKILVQLPPYSSFRVVLKSRLESLKEDW
jgi:predicted ATP-binding protein involved in virulence